MTTTPPLSGRGVRLEPLAEHHAPALWPLVDDALWAGMTTPVPGTLEAMTEHIRALTSRPGLVGFAVVDAELEPGAVAGVTTFYDIDLHAGRVEIGHTFYGRRWWGTHVNPAAKRAMLAHAFDVWGVERVALRADARNARSLAAIERLGATREGVLRSHRRAPDGSRGDTVYFSILRDEWPASRAVLDARLASRS
ncbi:GNAT family N-acetyltransferase [Sanguibacter sp. A247]|uniref:GNAT family N-acetyltransferase n=1 Tax=unclassified Sanguibacter TaxID=2645534 RepID=UPI003FD79736